MDDLECFSLTHKAAILAAGTTFKPDEQRDFERLAAYATACIQSTMQARQPKRLQIVFDIERGLVSNLAGEIQRLPEPALKGWRTVDLILRFGADMDFPGCAALLTGGGQRPDNTLRNRCNRVAGLLRTINRHLAVAIESGIKVACNGAIKLDSRDIPPIKFDA